MIVQEAQNAFNDKIAQFTLIPLGAAVSFVFIIPVGKGVDLDVLSLAGILLALPMILFAPLAGWVSDRFSKRDVMLGAAIVQSVVLACICGAVLLKNMPLAMLGFFMLATQASFFSPAKIGINKELLGSERLGFAAAIQQMVSILAILSGQILAGWLFDSRFKAAGGESAQAWSAALGPLMIVACLSLPALALSLLVPRVPAQGGPAFSPKLAFGHFLGVRELWRDLGLRRASFGVAFFWSFAAFINLWSAKLAKMMTGGGEGFGTQASIFTAAVSLGMASGFGFASFMMRRRIELGWLPVAGLMMTVMATVLAYLDPHGWAFLVGLSLLAFSGAVFLSPLNAWMQDRYPSDKRGILQSAVNLQDCFAGILVVVLIGVFEYGAKVYDLSPSLIFRVEIACVGGICGLMTLAILRLLPGDVIRLVGGAIVRTIYRMDMVHPERIPKKGGALLLPNHVSFFDGFLLSAATARPIRFVMDETFTARTSVRLFVRLFNTVTIRRDQPREAIREVISALKKGHLVCLFPEGQITRTGALGELERGCELIAKKAGYPLIPVCCDGAWGSIFSFERGLFFNKTPQSMPGGVTIAYGEQIDPLEADLAKIGHGMRVASAEAMTQRSEKSNWDTHLPARDQATCQVFSECGESLRRRLWVNGHQIGQLNALQRREPFFALTADPDLALIGGLTICFPDLFGAELRLRDFPKGKQAAAWVGGDHLREMLGTTQITRDLVFYDFGLSALQPIYRANLLHCPCLSLEGVVIAMSMPDPPRPLSTSDAQTGRKLGTWGKLLPGWYLVTSENGNLRAHGPAAPEGGIELVLGTYLDSEGFLGWQDPKARR